MGPQVLDVICGRQNLPLQACERDVDNSGWYMNRHTVASDFVAVWQA